MSPYKYRASSAERWVNCPASVALCESVPPKEETDAMREGTEAHARLAVALKAYTQRGAENVICLMTYEARAFSWLRENYLDRPGWVWEFEEEVSLAACGMPEVGGTADIIGHNADKTEWFVGDYKNGENYEYKTRGNLQLAIYLVGAIDVLLMGLPRKGCIAIIQPAFGEPAVMQAERACPTAYDDVREALLNPTTFKTGPHCDWCDARGVCPEIHETALVPTEKLREVGLEALSPEQLGRLVNVEKSLLKFVKAGVAYAQKLLLSGVEVPGTKLVLTKPHRKWAEGAEKAFLKAGLPVKKTHISALRSPNQIEEALGKEFTTKPAVVALVVQPKGKPTIAPTSDKRPEYKPATAAEVFQIEKEK